MKEYKGRIIASKARIGIVVSRFNELITKSLLSGALEGLERFGVSANNITIVWVPGSFEIPLTAKHLIKTQQVEAVICLGAIIRGATAHFEYVANQAAAGITQLSLETHTPIIFGILTTDNIEQALERAGSKAGNKGFEAAQTALEMMDLLSQMKGETPVPPVYTVSIPNEINMKC